MDKHDYGGAYDINPEEYWTKDDLMELKAAVEEIWDKKKEKISIEEIYLREDNSLDIVYTDKHENEWQLQAHIILDPEKAGTCKAMCKMYAKTVADTISSELKTFEAELEAEREEEYMDL